MIRALAALALLAIASSATAAQPAGIPAYCTTAGAFGHRFGVDRRGSRAHREFDHSIDPEFAPFTRVEITRTVRSGATYAINASSDFEDGDDEARQAAARAAYKTYARASMKAASFNSFSRAIGTPRTCWAMRSVRPSDFGWRRMGLISPSSAAMANSAAALGGRCPPLFAGRWEKRPSS